MIQLPTVNKTSADSPVDLMGLLPSVTNSGSRGAASFVLDNASAVDCYLASADDASLGARIEALSSYEAGPYDWPGARLWLHLPAGASCDITPFRSGALP